jgi:hypothetical protein
MDGGSDLFVNPTIETLRTLAAASVSPLMPEKSGNWKTERPQNVAIITILVA